MVSECSIKGAIFAIVTIWTSALRALGLRPSGSKTITSSACAQTSILQPLVPFTYGRVDCPTSPDTPILRTFPLAQMNHTETMDFYDKEFGMNVEEVVAISGAHTLGEMSGISGYKGFSKGSELENEKTMRPFDLSFTHVLVWRHDVPRSGRVHHAKRLTQSLWQISASQWPARPTFSQFQSNSKTVYRRI